MWWMTIPHIAIVSGLLLAGNNPNTLEGVVGRKTGPQTKPASFIMELVYDSRYRPAWIWFRGRSKRIWALRLQQTHGGRDADSEELREKIDMKPSEWLAIFFFAFGLIAIPSTLAFLTSFYTPRVGLSCRSMTFLSYMLCQFCLILLWIWNIRSTILDRDDQQELVPRIKTYTAWYNWIWWSLCALLTSCAIFCGIGGTMMQIIGVYRNCLCNIPMTRWRRRDDNELIIISTNAAEDIQRAATFWRGTGIAAVVFLATVSFIGWWYQKRLRVDFKKLIQKIDEPTMIEMQVPMNGQGSAQPNGVI